MVTADRLRQVLFLITFIPWCWLAMMVVHEAGHVLVAWLSGATIEQVVLHPFALSRTELGENPHPLLVSWAGALVGSGFPLLVWALARISIGFGISISITALAGARFFSGFCLVANGAYLGMGVWSGDGDAGDLLGAGAHVWQLVLFGVVSSAGGCGLWHGLSAQFGFRQHQTQITWIAAAVTSALLAMTVVLEVIFSCAGP